MAFDIVAMLQIRGPKNLTDVVKRIERTINSSNTTLKIKIDDSQVKSLEQRLGLIGRQLGSTASAANTLSTSMTNVGTSSTRASTGLTRTASAAKVAEASFFKINNSVNEGTAALERFSSIAGLSARRFLGFTVAAGSLIKLIQGIREGVSEAIVFDKEMVRLQQVSGETSDKISAISDEISRLSTTLGVSSIQLARSSVILKQAGLSAQETTQALEALAQASLAPNFDSMAQTTEVAIAVMKQFNVDASEFKSVLGSINAVAGAFAVEAGDLGQAIKKAGGSFAQTGGELNEFLALFTSVRSATRESANEIATGLRTIFTRIQRGDTVDILKDLGVNLRFAAGEAKDLAGVDLADQFVGGYEAVKRLSEGLSKLRSTDPRYSSIIEELGGYRQISRVLPLLSQFSEAQRALNVATAGQTSLTISAEKAQDALAVKISKVREEYLLLFRGIVNSDGFRTLADGAFQFATRLKDMIELLKPILPLLTAITTVKLASSIGGVLGGFSKGVTGTTRLATGGVVPGTGHGDIVPAMLEPGEFVIKKSAAQAIGYDKLHEQNKFASGGKVKGSSKKDLLSIIKGVSYDQILKRRLLDDLKSSKRLGDVAKFIPEGSTFLNSGTEALVLKSPDGEVIRIGKLIPRARTQYDDKGFPNRSFLGRPTHAEFLQPTARARFGNILVEKLPFVPSYSDLINQEVKQGRLTGRRNDSRITQLSLESEEAKKTLEDSLISKGIVPNDVGRSNFGPGPDGKPVIIDPNVGRRLKDIEKGRFASGGYVRNILTKYFPGVDFSKLHTGISFEDLKDSNGLFNSTTGKISIQKGLTNEQKLLSVFHELIHGADRLAGIKYNSIRTYTDTNIRDKYAYASEELAPDDFEAHQLFNRTYDKNTFRGPNSKIPGLRGVSLSDSLIQTAYQRKKISYDESEYFRQPSELLAQSAEYAFAKILGLNSSTSFQKLGADNYRSHLFGGNTGPLLSEQLVDSLIGQNSLKDFLVKLTGDKQLSLGAHLNIEKQRNIRPIRRFAKGGSAEDKIPAMLTPGEFVFNKDAARRIGVSNLQRMNRGEEIQGFNKGGIVGFSTGGSTDNERVVRGSETFRTRDELYSVSDKRIVSTVLKDIIKELMKFGLNLEQAKRYIINAGAGLTFNSIGIIGDKKHKSNLQFSSLTEKPSSAYTPEQQIIADKYSESITNVAVNKIGQINNSQDFIRRAIEQAITTFQYNPDSKKTEEQQIISHANRVAQRFALDAYSSTQSRKAKGSDLTINSEEKPYYESRLTRELEAKKLTREEIVATPGVNLKPSFVGIKEVPLEGKKGINPQATKVVGNEGLTPSTVSPTFKDPSEREVSIDEKADSDAFTKSIIASIAKPVITTSNYSASNIARLEKAAQTPAAKTEKKISPLMAKMLAKASKVETTEQIKNSSEESKKITKIPLDVLPNSISLPIVAQQQKSNYGPLPQLPPETQAERDAKVFPTVGNPKTIEQAEAEKAAKQKTQPISLPIIPVPGSEQINRSLARFEENLKNIPRLTVNESLETERQKQRPRPSRVNIPSANVSGPNQDDKPKKFVVSNGQVYEEGQVIPTSSGSGKPPIVPPVATGGLPIPEDENNKKEKKKKKVLADPRLESQYQGPDYTVVQRALDAAKSADQSYSFGPEIPASGSQRLPDQTSTRPLGPTYGVQPPPNLPAPRLDFFPGYPIPQGPIGLGPDYPAGNIPPNRPTPMGPALPQVVITGPKTVGSAGLQEIISKRASEIEEKQIQRKGGRDKLSQETQDKIKTESLQKAENQVLNELIKANKRLIDATGQAASRLERDKIATEKARSAVIAAQTSNTLIEKRAKEIVKDEIRGMDKEAKKSLTREGKTEIEARARARAREEVEKNSTQTSIIGGKLASTSIVSKADDKVAERKIEQRAKEIYREEVKKANNLAGIGLGPVLTKEDKKQVYRDSKDKATLEAREKNTYQDNTTNNTAPIIQGNRLQRIGETVGKSLSYIGGAYTSVKAGLDNLQQNTVVGRGIAGTGRALGSVQTQVGLSYLSDYLQPKNNAENAAYVGGEAAESYKQRKGQASALQGVAIGAAIGGGVAGPYGAVIGAVVGGLQGFTSAIREAEKEIRDVKINKSLSDFQVQLTNISKSGRNASFATISGIRSSLGNYGVESLEKAKEESRESFLGITTGYNIDKFIGERARANRQDLGGSLPLIAETLTRYADEIGRANPAKPLQVLQEELLQGNDGLNKTFIDMVASLRQIPIDEVKRELTATLRTGQRQAVVEKESAIARISEDRNVNAFGRLVLSLQATTDNLERLRTSSQLLLDSFDNVVNVSKVSASAANLNQLGRNDAGALRPLEIVSRIGGEDGQRLLQTGKIADSVANVLPSILATAAARAPVDETGFTTFVRQQLKSQTTESDEAINTVISQINKSTDKGLSGILEKVKIDTTKFSDELLRPFADPIKESGQKAAQLIEDNANRFGEGLVQLRQRLVIVGQEIDKLSFARQNRSEVEREIQGELSGRKVRPETIPLSDLQLGFRSRQERLTGFEGPAANNPRFIAAQLKDVSEQVRRKEDEKNTLFFSTGGQGQKYLALEKELINLKDRASNLQTALKFLAETTERNVGIQKQLNSIQEDKGARLSAGEKYYTSNFDERNQIDKGLILGSNPKNAQSLSDEDFRLAVSAYRLLGQAKITGIEGAPKGNEQADELIRQRSGGAIGLDEPTKNKEQELYKQYLDNLKSQELALQEVANFQKDTTDKFFTSLTKQQNEFFRKLEIYLAKDTTKILENKRGEAGFNVGRLEKLDKQRAILAQFGITDSEKLRVASDPKTKEQLRILGGANTTINQAEVLRDSGTINAAVRDAVNNTGQGKTYLDVIENIKNALASSPDVNPAMIDGIIKRFQQLVKQENPTFGADQDTRFNNINRFRPDGKNPSIEIELNAVRKLLGDKASQAFNEFYSFKDAPAGSPIAEAQRQRQAATDYLSGLGLDKFDGEEIYGKVGVSTFIQALEAFDPLKTTSNLENFDTEIKNAKDALIGLSDAIFNSKLKVNPFDAVSGVIQGAINNTGSILGFAQGTPRPIGTDTIPAMLSPGEFVVNAKATKNNLRTLQEMNRGNIKYLADGGLIGPIDESERRKNLKLQMEFAKNEEEKEFYRQAIKRLDVKEQENYKNRFVNRGNESLRLGDKSYIDIDKIEANRRNYKSLIELAKSQDEQEEARYNLELFERRVAYNQRELLPLPNPAKVDFKPSLDFGKHKGFPEDLQIRQNDNPLASSFGFALQSIGNTAFGGKKAADVEFQKQYELNNPPLRDDRTLSIIKQNLQNRLDASFNIQEQKYLRDKLDALSIEANEDFYKKKAARNIVELLPKPRIRELLTKPKETVQESQIPFWDKKGKQRELIEKELQMEAAINPYGASALLIAKRQNSPEEIKKFAKGIQAGHLRQRQLAGSLSNAKGFFGQNQLAGISSQRNLGIRGLQQLDEYNNLSAKRDFDIKKLLQQQTKAQQIPIKGYYSNGGIVPGTGSFDSVPALLTPGEGVLNQDAMKKLGKGNLQRLNEGGVVGNQGYGNVKSIDFSIFNNSVGSFVNSLGVFSSVTNLFSNSVNLFNQNASGLTEALRNFPSTLSINGSQKVEVIFNGAEVLSNIQGDLREMVENGVKDQLNRVFKMYMPEAGVNIE